MNKRSHAGFTLLEIMVALVISGLVVAALAAMQVVAADVATRVPHDVRTTTANRNAMQFARELFVQADPGPSGELSFTGTADSVAFTSWCPVGGGWVERCPVTLAIRPGAEGGAVELGWMGGSLTLARWESAVRLEYLRDARGGGTWVQQWGTAISPPQAVRVITDSLELILRIGLGNEP